MPEIKNTLYFRENRQKPPKKQNTKFNKLKINNLVESSKARGRAQKAA